ncbi:MAG: type II toxin-antitoxin system RelB/DinJ family antitoxin [Firmicutes bacterium]|nr:type II toxin-antitoxin system RelB/DinJ family antitoxin [Bacillota bacterium]
MAKTETVYTRVEPELKASAEQILAKLGLTPSEAINVFLNQVVLHKGLPFSVKVPDMTLEAAKAVLIAKLNEGEDSVAQGGWMTVEESKSLLGL